MDASTLNEVIALSGWFGVIPVILLVLNEGLKRVLDWPAEKVARYAVLVNWTGGVVLGIWLAPVGTTFVVSVLGGFLAGSSASGLYDGAKTFLKRD